MALEAWPCHVCPRATEIHAFGPISIDTEEHTLSSQVPPHPVQSKRKFTYILIKYFNPYTDTNLFDVKPMR